jgi:hypothetical protein
MFAQHGRTLVQHKYKQTSLCGDIQGCVPLSDLQAQMETLGKLRLNPDP